MKPQVALVSIHNEIASKAYNKALFFNGEYLVSADSDWTQFESIEKLAINLAKANNVDVTEIPCDVMDAGWCWVDIRDKLQSSGAIVGGLKENVIEHTFIDTKGDIHSKTSGLQAGNVDKDGCWDLDWILKSAHAMREHEKARHKVKEYVINKHAEMLWKSILVKEVRVFSVNLPYGMNTVTIQTPIEVFVCKTSEVDVVNWTDNHHCDTIYNVVPKLNASQKELIAFAERLTGKLLVEPSFEIYGYGAYIEDEGRLVKTFGAIISNNTDT